ncbi:hypothetical protein [Roseivivax sediminis]|uniref:Uncharacterized protein n=1 Tax=Roseivivax sediminis TaxID=936889 RepID=A0A1I1V4T5_9RHOB|nr:hypothetical protein [Roseivivax sediminis]SFD78052.1 hypothetical protein SAMN04515678_10316 [Roseivivax sediminis]
MSHLHYSERGTPLSSLGYSRPEQDALRVARHFFHAFCEPGKQGWISAFGHALRVRGPEDGPHLALATLNAIQSIRRIRPSPFRFNCPTCRECSLYLSGNERSYMNALRAAMRGDQVALGKHLWLLCEGNDPGAAEAAFRTLAELVESPAPVAG